MSLYPMLNGSSCGTYNRKVAAIIGLKTAIFLSELLYQYDFFKEYNQLIQIKGSEGEWFFMTVDALRERTCLSEKEQRLCVEKLTDLDFIKKTVHGLPAKRYFQVDEEKLHGLRKNWGGLPPNDSLKQTKGIQKNA